MKFITIFVCLSLAAECLAATQIIKEKGKPIEVIWDDGRKATVTVDREPVLVIEFPFGLDENTCNEVMKVNCTFKSSLRIDRYQVQWTAHPDAKKVGQAVSRKNTGPYLDFIFHSSAERLLGVVSALSMPADEMKCKSYSWLPGVGETAPETLDVSRWDSEAMFTNPETGLTENRIISGAVDLHWARNAAGDLFIEKARALIGLSLFQGDILALVHKTSDGFCQQSLKPNFGKVIDAINTYFGGIKNDFVPYPFGSDEFSDKANSNVANFLRNPDLGDLQ